MDIGYGLFTGQHRPDDPRSMSEIYSETVDLARRVEAAGLDSAWASEHHFTDDGYLSGTMPTLGALAAATDEIRIGTAVALAPFHHPIRLAEDGATVDLLSDGRFTAGLSIGYRDEEFEGFEIPKEERVGRTVETAELLRAAWSDGPLDYDAEYASVDPDVSVTPKPAQNSPPVVLGAVAKPAVRRAARLGDGWCANEALSVEDVRTRVEDIERVRRKEGLDGDFTVYAMQNGFVADSREEAWEAMKGGLLYSQRRYAEWAGGEAVEELPAERREEIREKAVFGSPEQVIEQLEAYRDALGDDVHFIFRGYHPGIGTETMADCIDLLGSEVAPHFR